MTVRVQHIGSERLHYRGQRLAARRGNGAAELIRIDHISPKTRQERRRGAFAARDSARQSQHPQLSVFCTRHIVDLRINRYLQSIQLCPCDMSTSSGTSSLTAPDI